MIHVDNSYNKRIFTDSSDTHVLLFKTKVEETIKECEDKNDFSYAALHSLEGNTNSLHLSVFKYKSAILSAISTLKTESEFTTYEKEFNDIEKNIFLLLIGSFEQIKEYVRQRVNSNSLLIYTKCDRLQSAFYKKYQKVFESLYENELSRNSKLKKAFFSIFDDMNVCPYCNRNFINPIYKDNTTGCDNETQSPDIEHFYPKSMYPFLSLSISNLLPSCSFCNKIKSNINTFEKCKSPYEIKKDDFKFEFKPQIGGNIHKISLLAKPDIDNSKVLHLESLYSEVHAQYVNDIYLDVLSHPSAYINSIAKILDSTEAKKKNGIKVFFVSIMMKKIFTNIPYQS
jgi:hypothetical protein